MYAKKNSGKKVVLTLLAIVLLIGCTIGATVAYLTAESDKVTNTFAVGKIKISLAETKKEGFTVVPGGEDEKDPVVTVEKGSEKCWVYVSVTNNLVIGNDTVATPNFDATKWNRVGSKDNTTVYKYMTEVDASTEVQNIKVFEKVAYDGDKITEDNIDTLKDKTIVLQAYAHQSAYLDTSVDVDALACAKFGVTPVSANS